MQSRSINVIISKYLSWLLRLVQLSGKHLLLIRLALRSISTAACLLHLHQHTSKKANCGIYRVGCSTHTRNVIAYWEVFVVLSFFFSATVFCMHALVLLMDALPRCMESSEEVEVMGIQCHLIFGLLLSCVGVKAPLQSFGPQSA